VLISRLCARVTKSIAMQTSLFSNLIPLNPRVMKRFIVDVNSKNLMESRKNFIKSINTVNVFVK